MLERKLVVIVVTLTAGMMLSSGVNCKLPDFLQTNITDPADYWMYHVTIDGIKVKVTVNNSSVLAHQVGWGSDQILVFDGNCSKIIESEKYIMEYTNDTTVADRYFICFSFEKVTEQVVLLHAGDPGDELDDKLCDDLRQTDWPLVANLPKSREPVSCVLAGAFTFTANSTTFNQDTEVLCSGHPVRPLLESDCTVQEGLRLSFPDSSCVPGKTGWTTDQKLVCLDTWKQEEATLQLLGTEFGKPRWCMRIPDKQDGEFYAQIFQDLTCPPFTSIPLNGTSLVDLTMTQYDTKDCEDFLGAQCSELSCTDKLTAHYCMKTCNLCSTEDPCSFDESVVTEGEWQDFQTDGATTSVSFTKDSVTVKPFSALSCHSQVDAETYVTHAEVGQGCRARFSCAKFKRYAPGGAVLAYKLGQNVLVSYEKDYDVCTEDNFEDDAEPLGSRLHSRNMKNLIAMDSSLLEKTVLCGFAGNFSVQAVDGSTCSGFLSDIEGCDPQSSMKVQLDCNSDTPSQTGHSCLAEFSLREGGPRFIITKVQDDDIKRHNCWVRSEDPGVLLRQLGSPQCNDVTMDQITAGLADIELEVNMTRVDECGASTEGTSTPGGTTASTEPQTVEPTDSPSATTPSGGGGGHQTAAVVLGVLFGLALAVILAYIGYKYYVRKSKTPYRVL